MKTNKLCNIDCEKVSREFFKSRLTLRIKGHRLEEHIKDLSFEICYFAFKSHLKSLIHTYKGKVIKNPFLPL